MKRNSTLILISTAVFSWLFYKQATGINYFLFNVLLMALLLIRDVTLIRSRSFLVVVIGNLTSAFATYWYGTDWPWMMNFFSLLILAGLSFLRESSLPLALFHALYSTVFAPIFVVTDQLFNRFNSSNTNSGQQFKRIVLAFGPIAVVFIFIQIYRSGNPIFDKYVSKINFDFISFGWLFFTLLGFYLSYSFFKQRVVQQLLESENRTPDELSSISLEQHTGSYFGQLIQVSNEVFTGILLLVLLNIVLAIVNGLDFYFVFVQKALPKDIGISQYVHQGTNSLIFSIILASLIILFYFRGYLNFYEKNKWLKFFSYLWIAQNILLLFSTAYRNGMYIDGYGLTHKRIGVLVYLLLSLVGLVTVAIKIFATKNNWFLFRKNAWAVYVVLISYCMLDWDSIITNYNLHHFVSDKKMEIDQRYLVDLSHTNLSTLFQFYIVEKKKLLEEQKEENETDNSFESSRLTSRDHDYEAEIEHMIWQKYRLLRDEYRHHDWQSECRSKTTNLNKVNELIAQYQLSETTYTR